MPTKRTRRSRTSQRPEVSRALFHFLVWRDWQAASALATSDFQKWQLFDVDNGVDLHARGWRAIEAEGVAAWTTVYAGSRPTSWWWWSSPELRRVYGRFVVQVGQQRCQESGVPYGAPVDWDDRPMVESQPAYLDRLGLWVPGERARVAPEAFEAAPFSWALTVSPRGRPDAD